MGQKANPIGLRLGIINGWDSSWFAKRNYAEKLVEDVQIRNYIAARIPKAGISKVVIERASKRITITIHTARPGVVIGKGGAEIDKVKEELKKITKQDVQLNISEIRKPETDARLVGESIAQQLEARISYRRAMKNAIASAMRVGAQGIKVKCSGRLGGAEMARTELYKEGRIPLHTLRADIDYAIVEAQTVYGKIGIKVWVFKGEVYGKRELSPNSLAADQNASASNEMRGNDRGGRGGNDRGPRGAGNDRGGNDRGRNNNNNNRGGQGGGNNRGGQGGGGNRPGGGGGAGGGNRGPKR
jgi:small subunit ribosomal protein S3